MSHISQVGLQHKMHAVCDGFILMFEMFCLKGCLEDFAGVISGFFLSENMKLELGVFYSIQCEILPYIM